VGDQRLVGRQFQLELVAQEPGQTLLDFPGLGLGTGEPEEMVIGLCGLPDYAARLIFVLVTSLEREDRRHNRRAGQRVLR
jgi:hypothetical protein